MLIQEGNHMTIAAANLSQAQAPQHQDGEVFHHLSPAKAQQYMRTFMDDSIKSAANSASSSKHNFLGHLMALRERDYQNAPDSNLVLSYKGGLIGGSGESSRAGNASSSGGGNTIEQIPTSLGTITLVNTRHGYVVDCPKPPYKQGGQNTSGGATFGPFPTRALAFEKAQEYLGLPKPS